MALPVASVQLYTLAEQFSADMSGSLERLAAIGLQNVEAFDFVRRPNEIRAALDAAGLASPTGHAPLLSDELWTPDGSIPTPGPEVVFEAAATVGITTVIDPFVAADRWLTEDGVEDIAERINAAGRGRRGVRAERRVPQPRAGVPRHLRRADRVRAVRRLDRGERGDRARPVLGPRRGTGCSGADSRLGHGWSRVHMKDGVAPASNPFAPGAPAFASTRSISATPATGRAAGRFAAGRYRAPVRGHRVRQPARRRLRRRRRVLGVPDRRRVRPMSAVGVGMIGVGVISDTYLENLDSFPDVEVVIVGDLIADRARSQAEKHGIPAHGTADGRPGPPRCAAGREPDHAGRAHRGVGGRDRGGQARLVGEAARPGPGRRRCAARAGAGRRPPGRVRPRHAPRSRASRAPSARSPPGVIGEPLFAQTAFQTQGPDLWHPNPGFLFSHGAGPLLDMGPYYFTALVSLLGPVDRVAAVGHEGASEQREIRTGPNAGSCSRSRCRRRSRCSPCSRAGTQATEPAELRLARWSGTGSWRSTAQRARSSSPTRTGSPAGPRT